MSRIAGLALAALHRLDPERAHHLTVLALRSGLLPRAAAVDDPRLGVQAFGRRFANPVGLAAGFDKNAEVIDAMLGQGFGFAEAGSITPRPQAGNPRPRIFRLAEDRAVINRLGFNNQGLDAAAGRLAARRQRPGIVGANLGANKDSTDRIEDYVTGLRRLGPLVDYVTINVSSPNTPGLRALQGRAELDELLGRLYAARKELPRAVPLVLKIAPDLTAEDRADIAAVALDHGLEGLIVGNTTIGHRGALRSPARGETGGLSGVPLYAPSTAILADMYRLTAGKILLIGTGGIASGADAYAKIRAGATLVQLYTALIYRGPGLVGEIKRDLAALLARDGFATVAAAVGADHRQAEHR